MKTTTPHWCRWLLALVVIPLLFTTAPVQAQVGTSCTSPVFITAKEDCSFDTYTYGLNESEVWFEFKAIGTDVTIQFSLAGLPFPATIDHVFLHDASNCTTPIADGALSPDSLIFRATGLVDGNLYRLGVTRLPIAGPPGSAFPEASFKMCVVFNPKAPPPPDNSDCFTCGGGNLVFNGDFELGATGFGTSHNFVPVGNAWGVGTNNQYSVTTPQDVEDFNGTFWTCPNRTAASTQFMICDIASADFPTQFIWLQDVAVVPNTTYYFSCWVNNLVDNGNMQDPNITLLVNGVSVETAIIGESPDEWIYLCGTYTTPSSGTNSTNAHCVIYSNVEGSPIDGHDIAIDDIVLTAGNVPPDINASETTICVGQCVTIYTSAQADFYDWGNLHPTTTVPFIEICPTAPGTISASVTVICGEGGVTSEDIFIEVEPFPFDIPDIIGSNQMCCDDQEYTVPFNLMTTYNWSITPPTSFTGQGTNTIQVDWSTTTATNSVIELVLTSPEGCTASTFFNVEACCLQPSPASPFFYITNHCEDAFASDLINNVNGGNNTVNIMGQSIVINGTFIVDAPNLTFLNVAEFYLGQEAQIIIESGNSLVFDNCTLQASCNAMWDGIYIEDNTASLTMNDNTVRDALNAVVSQNGGHYDLTNNEFTQNYKVLRIEAYNAPHTGVFEDNDVNTISNVLLSPYNGGGRRGFVGVEMVDNSLVTIQDNTFDNLDFGVRSTRSNTNVYQNDFTNLTNTIGSPDQTIGSAVFAQSIPATVLLRVGGSNNLANTFTNCFQGVHAENNVSTAVGYNTFTNMGLLGVSVDGNIGGIITVNNNTFNNPGIVGVNCFANDNTVINVESNNITFPVGGSTSFIDAGIVIETPFAQLTNPGTTILNNFIVEPERGIRLNNIPGAIVNNNNVRWFISNQDVLNNPVDLKGILLTNCVDAEVRVNQIFRLDNSNPTVGSEFKLVGIESRNSNNIEIVKNTTRRMGSGVFMVGSNSGSTLACNTANRDWAGFQFDDADIGDQGASNSPSDNKWQQNSGPVRMAGGLDNQTPADWHHRTGNSFDPNPIPLALGQDLSLLGGASGQSECAGGGIGPGPQRERQFGKIVRNEKVFVNNAQEHQFYDEFVTYEALSHDPTLLNLGLPDDGDYQAFHSAIATTNVGKLCQVQKDIELGNYTSADALNSSITPANLMEANCQRVYEIYLNTWATGIRDYSPQQQADLEAIACQDGLTGGMAVYSARAMIGWMNLPCSHAKSLNAENKPTKPVEASYVSKIYPNPNNGVMQLDYQLNEGEQGVLHIVDLSGKLIATYNLNTANSTMVITENSLVGGVYLYRITVNNTVLDTGKLVIVK